MSTFHEHCSLLYQDKKQLEILKNVGNDMSRYEDNSHNPFVSDLFTICLFLWWSYILQHWQSQQSLLVTSKPLLVQRANESAPIESSRMGWDIKWPNYWITFLWTSDQ